MSRFICPEFDADLKGLCVERPTAAEYYTTDDGEMMKKAHVLRGQDGQTVLYANDLIKKLAFSYNLDATPRTMAAHCTNMGLTLTTNLSSTVTAKTYYFNHRRPLEIKTDLWYTIYTDTGVMMVAPVRLTTSRKIGVFDVVADQYNAFQNSNISGETGQDISLVMDNTIVNPVTLDSALKAEVLRKWKSKQRVLTIQTGHDANALDWFDYEGLTFLVVSKKVNAGRFIYTAVQEINQAYTFAAASITLTSNWGIIESGSNANGSYVKYADGTMECIITKTVAIAGASWSAWGSIYISFIISTAWTYPATFVSAPAEIAMCRNNASSGAAAWLMGENNNSNTATGRYYICRGATVGNETWVVDIIAKGRWRA